MNTEQRLNAAADRYRALGYRVTLRPEARELPSFAKDFNVELLATRADGSVLASVKRSQADLAADPNVPRYAEVTSNQPGWRYDLIVLGQDDELAASRPEVKELSEEDIRRSLDKVQDLVRSGFVETALLAAWAALEAAMRRRLRAGGEEAGWETSPRTMLNELYAEGALSPTVFRDLESLFQQRHAIAHGFAPQAIDPSAVHLVVDTARRLLAEPPPAKQTA